ncbi:hypothetical protein NP493_241g01007 [Ridgeia piscesae]|uniref:Uncharacterized protein n=1 Tax=Ridgeia piscesae TaxID=27915 RepID=A0AAD9NZA5_RIDPI|nr:hypothetical protein NP493_241g01007 [Ridgeia piscesae]
MSKCAKYNTPAVRDWCQVSLAFPWGLVGCFVGGPHFQLARSHVPSARQYVPLSGGIPI